MAKTLEQILGGRNLTGVINETMGGVPDDLLPPALMRPGRTIDGDRGTYMKVENTRATARRARYGSKSKEVDQVGLKETAFIAIHTVEHQRHNAAMLMNLRGMNGEGKQRLGEQEVDRQVIEFGRRFKNLRLGAIYSAFANGNIWFDGSGNLLPSSSGASLTVDFQVPAGHQNQLDVFGDGDIIDASWATDTTDIIGHVKQIKAAARKEGGGKLMHAFYGLNIPEYFASNDQLSEYLNRRPDQNTALQSGEVPNGFMNLNWWSMNEAFYEDNDGTLQDFFGDDTIVFLPDPNPEWYELVEGTFAVPRSIDIHGDSPDMGQFDIATGAFSYAKVEDDPPSIKHVAGDTFLPIIKNPKSVFIADVTP